MEMRPAELEGVIGLSGDELVAEPDDAEEMEAERARPLAVGIVIGSVCLLLELIGREMKAGNPQNASGSSLYVLIE
jgi:hypothetical protein